jgi:hypothetical protein
MSDIPNPLWAPHCDYATASTAMQLGTIAAATGAGVAFVVAALEYGRSGFDITRVMVPTIAGGMSLAAGLYIRRQSGAAAQVALWTWVVLGLFPTNLSLVVAIPILVCLVAAVRGARVLSKKNSDPSHVPPNKSVDR